MNDNSCQTTAIRRKSGTQMENGLRLFRQRTVCVDCFFSINNMLSVCQYTAVPQMTKCTYLCIATVALGKRVSSTCDICISTDSCYMKTNQYLYNCNCMYRRPASTERTGPGRMSLWPTRTSVIASSSSFGTNRSH